jgi:uncharacterized repeat protein (TIGR03803 family)
MPRFDLARTVWIVFVFCAATALTSPATTTFTTLVGFDGTNGAYPGYTPLVQGTDGSYYGTTYEGGANNLGTVFKITTGGTLTTLYSFCSQTSCTDGELPYAGLVQASNGNFYGTTVGGGAKNGGTVFEITPRGKLTTLYSFCSQTSCTDGELPYAGLVQATNGNFYGTTLAGGANGKGTVFEITAAGTLTTLYSFCSQPSCADGELPYAGLVQATNGNFYGTTPFGGAKLGGTVFEITPQGKLTTLYSFCSQTSCTDGQSPYAGLVQAIDRNLYGTTYEGGANTDGTVFEITLAGKLTTLYSFCSQTSCTDGENPTAGLVQASNGNLYGTTLGGGANTDGTVFSLSVGLDPFVETLPGFGKVGAAVIILGTNLTGSTSVSFSGTAATFTVVSGTEITATVPAGATTGTVSVTTPGGTINSNVKFRVIPQITSFTPTGGAVGTVVTITGVSLTQTTAVSFGGVKASSFTVNSDTQVTATVPTGAKTGKIAITTPGGTATSPTSFAVT